MGVADGSNPAAVIVPLHRVIASNGYLESRACDLHCKRPLLNREKAIAAKVQVPEQLLACAPELQRSCGFSAAKLETIRGIAQATIAGVVPSLTEAWHLPDEALIERLTSLRGVGRWTVEMFLIYSLERSDILPVDDFGIREGYRRLRSLEKAPSPKQMREIGKAWSPFRTVASWYLWRVPRR